jgi:hypothetical protein
MKIQNGAQIQDGRFYCLKLASLSFFFGFENIVGVTENRIHTQSNQFLRRIIKLKRQQTTIYFM